MLNFYQSINFFKIRTKLLLLIILSIFISLGIFSWLSYYIYTASIKEKAVNYNLNEINTINRNLDSYFNRIEFMASTLAYNNLIQNCLTRTYKAFDQYAAIRDVGVRNILYTLSTANYNLQITLFPEDISSPFYSTGLHTNPYYNYKNDNWYRIIKGSEDQQQVISNNPQIYLDSSIRKPVYTLIYKCLSFDRKNILGYILIDINKFEIDRFFENSHIDITSTIIIDKNNNLVYSLNSDFLTNDISSSLEKEINRQGYLVAKIKGVKYLISYGVSNSIGWKVINIIPYNSLFRDIGFMKYLILFTALFLLIITILFTYHYASIITRPLEKLKDGMDEIMKGNLDTSLSTESKDEIGELYQDFNKMINKIQILIKETDSSNLLKKEAELKSLQHQINPHFLYNTLEMIIGLTYDENARKVRTICRTLGSMFRYNLTSDKIVTIEDELSQVKRYVYIMEQRFEGRFETYYEIDTSLLKFKTLKFFLQPLVENAINYGFSDTIEGGKLTIKIVKNNNRIEFDINDNGQGFNLERLNEINRELQTSKENPYDYIDKYNHIGIMNVHLRLVMLFKQDCSMNIQSIPLGGTCVKILIPITQ